MMRRGVALLTVLWLLVVAGTLTLTISAGGRDASAASDNRAMMVRASWQAQGCAARVVAALDAAMRSAAPGREREAVWRHLERAAPVMGADDPAGCRVVMRSTESGLDVNAAPESAIRSYLAARFERNEARRITAAVLDWSDPDPEPRGDGAEEAWYRARERIGPRNGPFRSDHEFALVRGLEAAEDTREALRTEGGFIIDVMHAPAAVLGALPGVSTTLASEIVRRREVGWAPSDVRELLDLVPSALAPDVSAAFDELSRVALLGPRGWFVEATVHGPRREIARTEQWRVARGVGHLVVTARRVW